MYEYLCLLEMHIDKINKYVFHKLYLLLLFKNFNL